MVQEATKKETMRVSCGTALCVCAMIVVFVILHAVVPEQVPFDAAVVLGGFLGGAVAAANFFLMGLTVQNVAAEKDEKKAYQKMKTSYTYRLLFQLLWVVLAFVLPFLNGAAGVIPLFFPSLVVKVYYVFLNKEAKKKPSVSEKNISERGEKE